MTCRFSSLRHSRLLRRLAAALGIWAVPAWAQVDTIPRNLIEIGYDQTAVGRGPQSEYAYYYYNRPDFFGRNVGLRAAIAPAYLDSEIGLQHLLSPTTDVGLGLAGGAFGDNFYDVAQGNYRENESFNGSGGGAAVSIYQRVNPGMRIPLNLMVREGFRYSTYFDTSKTAKNFELPGDQLRDYTRVGLRFGGRQPLLFPALGLELSAWFERQRDFGATAYGFSDDRRLSPATNLYWAYAGLNYQFKPSGDQLSFGFTAGGSTNADLFSAWRLGGVLPLVSEYPLMLPGYYYEELTAIRFVHVYGAYQIPLDEAQRWNLLLEAATARLDYLPGYAQPGEWQNGAGTGIAFSPRKSRYKVILRAGYGFNALRRGKEGTESVGLLFQWDLAPRKSQPPAR